MAKRGRIYRRTKKDPITGERMEVGPFKIQIWLNGKASEDLDAFHQP